MSVDYLLGISSVDAIRLYPDRTEYSFGTVLIRDDNRLDNGKLKTYIQAEYDSYNMNLSCVSSCDAMIVNSWWESGAELLLFVVSDSAVDVNSVMIMGDESPFQSFCMPYEDRFNGSINLESY